MKDTRRYTRHNGQRHNVRIPDEWSEGQPLHCNGCNVDFVPTEMIHTPDYSAPGPGGFAGVSNRKWFHGGDVV